MEELNEARRDAGLSVGDACAWLGRSERTWRRWERHGAPRWAIEALRLRAGFLDALGWPGWRLVQGELYAPELRHGFRPGDIYRAWWDRQRLELQEKTRSAGRVVELQAGTIDQPRLGRSVG